MLTQLLFAAVSLWQHHVVQHQLNLDQAQHLAAVPPALHL